MSGDELGVEGGVLGLSKFSDACCSVEFELIGTMTCCGTEDGVLNAAVSGWWEYSVLAKFGEVLLTSDSRFWRSGKAHYGKECQYSSMLIYFDLQNL